MRFAVGIAIFATIVAVIHDAAQGGVQVRCQPITVPTYTHCFPVIGEPFTKQPLRCRVS